MITHGIQYKLFYSCLIAVYLQQNNLFKAQQGKYSSRIRVLEELAKGAHEENKVSINSSCSHHQSLHNICFLTYVLYHNLQIIMHQLLLTKVCSFCQSNNICMEIFILCDLILPYVYAQRNKISSLICSQIVISYILTMDTIIIFSKE